MSLVELGEDVEGAERQLLRWHHHPAVAREAAAWAWCRHVTSLAPGDGDGDPSTTPLTVAAARPAER